MKKVLLSLIICVLYLQASAQANYMTRNGQISFFSKTSMENIDAVNNEVTSIINTGTGEIVYAVLVKSFRFEKALMEEHFNENYMESDKFPKSTFSGKLTNLSAIDFKKNGSYPATVEGDMTIHGIKQHVTASGTIVVNGNKISITSTFSIKLADYKIEVPSLVAEKIAESIEVKVNCQYEPKS
ncbi:MAG: YceI family protein [Cyclobacteriaceae bacterium]|nr:YceI family protein [Cyclobacteriaceae bacterium]